MESEGEVRLRFRAVGAMSKVHSCPLVLQFTHGSFATGIAHICLLRRPWCQSCSDVSSQASQGRFRRDRGSLPAFEEALGMVLRLLSARASVRESHNREISRW